MTGTVRLDRSMVIKAGMLGSALLVLGGFLGSWAVAGAPTVPAWEQSIFLDAEVVGTLGLLFVPLVIGVVLPLVK